MTLKGAWPLLWAAVLAAAGPVPADLGTIHYVVRPGDTLKSLSAQLTGPNAAGMLASRNRLRPDEKLLPGKILDVPAVWLRSIPILARIRSFGGNVRIEGGPAVRIGAGVGEGARIVTGADASISLGLPDGSVVTVPSSSALKIVRLRRITLSAAYDRLFVLEAGRSEYQVTPDRHVGSRFEIRTPVSVAAVRGTVFRVSVPQPDGANTEVLRGDVAVTGRTAALDLAQGFGAHSDRASTGTPVKLLPPPRITTVSIDDTGSETVMLDPVDGAHQYRVQLASDGNFVNILAERTGEDPALPIPSTNLGIYYLRATALDKAGLEGLPDIGVYHHVREGSRLPPKE